MIAAYESVKKEEIGIREAGRHCNVPHETHRRRVFGNVELYCKLGPSTVLTADEEKRLVKYILDMGEMGFGLSHDDLQIVAYKVAKKVGRPHPFQSEKTGCSWLNGFFKCHPLLNL